MVDILIVRIAVHILENVAALNEFNKETSYLFFSIDLKHIYILTPIRYDIATHFLSLS
jgi:hypothetical protein